LPLARETDRIIDQVKAMPVPVSNDGNPNCFNPLGRTKFFTRNAKAEMESFGVGLGPVPYHKPDNENMLPS
jgi:hypothetical protein